MKISSTIACITLGIALFTGCASVEPKVTLEKPYPLSYKDAPTDKISVQYAVIKIAKQAGYKYDWKKSYKNTNPKCRQWVYIEFKHIPFEEAMKQILDPFKLTYEIKDKTIILKRKTGKLSSTSPAPRNMKKAQEEVNKYYSKAHPEVQEYILWTARVFGPSKRWLNEDAFTHLSNEQREKKIVYIMTLLNDSEYGRHLCKKLAEASVLKDKRLVPGLIKIAAYSKPGTNYDCAPKWMAVAALARQQSDDAVPLLISLVDHGNQNTRMWARAALARRSGHDFRKDKQAWDKLWQAQGNKPIDKKLLKPYKYNFKKKSR